MKQQTEQDDFDTMDSRHASVRWFTGDDVGFAIGPSHVDPRSGEILDADIGMSDVFARGARRQVAEDFTRLFDREASEPAHAEPHWHRARRGFLACNYWTSRPASCTSRWTCSRPAASTWTARRPRRSPRPT